MFDIAVALVYACNKKLIITVPNVTLDLGKNTKGHLEDIIDIEETNVAIRCKKCSISNYNKLHINSTFEPHKLGEMVPS